MSVWGRSFPLPPLVDWTLSRCAKSAHSICCFHFPHLLWLQRMGMTHQWALLFSNGAKRLCLFQLIAPYIGAACVFCLLLCILYFCNIIVVLVKSLRMIYRSLKYRHRVHIVLPHACLSAGISLLIYAWSAYLFDTLVNLTYVVLYLYCWVVLIYLHSSNLYCVVVKIHIYPARIPYLWGPHERGQ